jgi:hypothetical protein
VMAGERIHHFSIDENNEKIRGKAQWFSRNV